MWKLNMFLYNEWVKDEIKEKSKNILKHMKVERTHQSL